MTRKQLFLTLTAASVMMAGLAAPSQAGLVEIKLLTAGGAVQSLTLYVPETCSRTEWPDYVIDCKDLDPDFVPEEAPVHYVVNPRGRVFKMARLSTGSDLGAHGGDTIGFPGRDGNPGDDVEQLGTTIGGGSEISVVRDEDNKISAAILNFKNDNAWKKFLSGEESADVAATWGTVKARYGR